MSVHFHKFIFIGALVCAFVSCRKSENTEISQVNENYEDTLAGTWLWAHYTSGLTPQGTPNVKLADTTLTISKIAVDTIYCLGYKFHYTDSLAFYANHYKQPVDLSKYRCFQAYNGEHDYLYLRLSLADDSVYIVDYHGGHQYGEWEKFHTCLRR